MDTAQWPQEIGAVKSLEERGGPNSCTRDISSERRATRPQKEQALNCPRCNSTNTKFCYYNNYSLTQPRYFCKGCRRYWTEGGTLRNVPVGGGSRKNKRSTTSTSSASSKLIINPSDHLNPPNLSQFSISQNPKKIHQGQDLNLSFPTSSQDHNYQSVSTQFIELPKIENNDQHNITSSPMSISSISALELLRSGIASRGLNSYMPMMPMPMPMPMPDSNTSLYSSGFSFQELKPSLNFCVDGIGSLHGVQENINGGAGRLLFPLGGLKQVSSTAEADQSKGQGGSSTHGYWNNGMLGGGSW